MKTYRFVAWTALLLSGLVSSFAWAQDLGPQIRKIKDGIYVYVGKNLNSNAGIVLTQYDTPSSHRTAS